MAYREDIHKGVVSAYDTFKGFGFIRREKGKDVFFFYDEIEDDGIAVGDVVVFSLRDLPKGPRAYGVRKLAIS